MFNIGKDKWKADIELPKRLQYLRVGTKAEREYAKEPKEPYIISNIHVLTWTFTNPKDGNALHPDIFRYQAWERTNQIQLRFMIRQQKFLKTAKDHQPSLVGPENRSAQVTGGEPQARQYFYHHGTAQVRAVWRQLIEWQQDYIDEEIVFQPENAHGRTAGSGWGTEPVRNPVSRKVDPFIRKHTYLKKRDSYNMLYPVLIVALPHPAVEGAYLFRPLLPTDVPETLQTSIAKAYNFADKEPSDEWKMLQYKKGILWESREETERIRKKMHAKEKDPLGGFVEQFIDTQRCGDSLPYKDAPQPEELTYQTSSSSVTSASPSWPWHSPGSEPFRSSTSAGNAVKKRNPSKAKHST
jgi:hypothetical protein